MDSRKHDNVTNRIKQENDHCMGISHGKLKRIHVSNKIQVLIVSATSYCINNCLLRVDRYFQGVRLGFEISLKC